MKTKLLLLLIAAFLFHPVLAQDDDKSFKFGLKAIPSVNWYKPDDKKKLESAGSLLKFGYGLMMDFKLAGAAWFCSGLQVDYDGGKLNFLDTVCYQLNLDNEFVKDPVDSNLNFRLDTRTYKVNYLTIPLTLRLRTNEVGMMTYFGQFGFPLSIRMKARAVDEVRPITDRDPVNTFGSISTKEDLDITNDMGVMNIGLTIGGGAEYNMSGSTSIIFGINYTQGFLNVLRPNSIYNIKDPGPIGPTSGRSVFSEKVLSRNIGLTVGILF